MATILITGGTGMIGSRLMERLIAKGYDVCILTRSGEHKEAKEHVSYASWDIEKGYIDKEAIAKADHIIHLAGENVGAKRWTEKRKQAIVESRTKSSALIVTCLADIPNKVKTVVSASAIGWYGPDTAASKQKGFHEDAPPDTAFLGETCRLWEESIQPVEKLGKRLVKLRCGIVLSKSGGALDEFKKPLKAGVASILGDGKQVISWIHIDDLCNLYIAAIENESMQGAYNAVTPHPVTNKELVLSLAKQMRDKYYIPIHVPAFALKLLLGEMSIEVLKSATVSADKISTTGFYFEYPQIDQALAASL